MLMALTGSVLAEGKADVKESIQVEMVGTVKTGIAAIGGETTGVLITANGITWELDPGKLRDKVDKMDGKKAVAKGTFAIKEGVEIRRRSILTADSVEPAGEKDKEGIKVEIRGQVRTGVVAAGGETTGVTITAGGVTWELDLGKNKEFQTLAETRQEKKFHVTGTLEMKKPAAAPPRPRMIVTVETLKVIEGK